MIFNHFWKKSGLTHNTSAVVHHASRFGSVGTTAVALPLLVTLQEIVSVPRPTQPMRATRKLEELDVVIGICKFPAISLDTIGVKSSFRYYFYNFHDR